jgi:hypothetical protein
MKMTKKTEKALKKCIEGWKTRKLIDSEYAGPYECELCSLYSVSCNIRIKSIDFSCSGCPIFKSTGEQFCRKTPVDNYNKALMRSRKADSRRHAREMIALMEELLPKEKTT